MGWKAYQLVVFALINIAVKAQARPHLRFERQSRELEDA